MNKQHKNHSLRYANYFSIRKLTVGVASITLGTAIFLGTNHEAQAAEDTTSQAITNSAASSGQNTNTAHPTGASTSSSTNQSDQAQPKNTTQASSDTQSTSTSQNNSNNNASNTTQSTSNTSQNAQTKFHSADNLKKQLKIQQSQINHMMKGPDAL